jgi:hypothetical protein
MADPPQVLDAGTTPPVGVANPSQIEFYIGNPPRQMLVFSGVGVTEVHSEDNNVAWRDFRVMLGASTTPNFQYTSTVGMATITCDDSDFFFFSNTSNVDQDPLTGELRLNTTLAASGDSGTLNRFSYQVMVLSDPIVGTIAGEIRWANMLGQPSDAVLNHGAPMFTVDVGVNVDQPGDLIDSTEFQARASGYTTAIPRNYNGTWVVPYKIDNVPLGTAFVVQPRAPGPNLVGVPTGYEGANAYYNPSQRAVELTPSAPSAVGIDFDMFLPAAPR